MGEFAVTASLGAGTTAIASPGGLEGFGAFWRLSVPIRATVLAAATLLLAVLVVGLFPDYGTTAVERVKRKTVSSFLIGSVVAVVFGVSIGVIWTAAGREQIAAFIAMPVLFVLLGLATLWTAIGLVGLCQAVADRAGRDHPAWGVLGAVLVAGGSVAVPTAGAAVAVLAATLGFGAGIRTIPGKGSRTERTVPPERKV